MPDVNVYDAFKELLQKLFSGDTEVAELAATDPEGLLTAYGLTDASLDGVDFRQVVADTYQEYDLPEGGEQALQSYLAGEPAPDHYQVKEPPAYSDGYQPVDSAVQHLQYVTYAAYEHNEHITQEISQTQLLFDQSDQRTFNIDNSTDVAVDVDGDLLGDVTVEATNVTAAGDNTGLLAGGDVDNPVIGDGNQTANLDINTAGGAGGSANGTGGDASGTGGEGGFGTGASGFGGNASGSGGDANGFGGNAGGIGGDASGGAGGDVGPINLNFGSGDVSNTDISGDLDNSAVAVNGDAGNVADNRVDDGAALAVGDGDTAGNQQITEDSFNQVSGARLFESDPLEAELVEPEPIETLPAIDELSEQEAIDELIEQEASDEAQSVGG